MSVVKKILVMTAMLFGLVTMINYVNFLFGNNYLFIYNRSIMIKIENFAPLRLYQKAQAHKF